MNVQRLLKNAPIFPRNVARAYISFHVDEHRKTSANTLYVNFNAKDGDHMQIYYVENRPEKVFRFAWTAYLFG